MCICTVMSLMGFLSHFESLCEASFVSVFLLVNQNTAKEVELRWEGSHRRRELRMSVGELQFLTRTFELAMTKIIAFLRHSRMYLNVRICFH